MCQCSVQEKWGLEICRDEKRKLREILKCYTVAELEKLFYVLSKGIEEELGVL